MLATALRQQRLITQNNRRVSTLLEQHTTKPHGCERIQTQGIPERSILYQPICMLYVSKHNVIKCCGHDSEGWRMDRCGEAESGGLQQRVPRGWISRILLTSGLPKWTLNGKGEKKDKRRIRWKSNWQRSERPIQFDWQPVLLENERELALAHAQPIAHRASLWTGFPGSPLRHAHREQQPRAIVRLKEHLTEAFQA
jgi:hypothetical protein